MIKYLKKSLAIVLSLVVLISSLSVVTINYASDYLARYSGSTTASYGFKPNCVFTIYEITNSKFRGNFTATNLGNYNVNQDVEGKVYSSFDSFTCVFSYTNYYNTSFVITVYPNEGYCECITSGNWHFEDFKMTGTKFGYTNNNKISGNAYFNETDLMICMLLSCVSYSGDNNYSVKENINKCIVLNEFDLDTKNIKSYNFGDNKKDNVAFSLAYRNNGDNSADLFVIVRGSLDDEWIGNTEITGESFDSECQVHKNFDEAKNSIKDKVTKYYKTLSESYSNVNLIITGHSRGAAVANLYAKEATDSINGTYDDSIPTFSSVTAYTFACPNVEKYNESMENYDSIFNFCLSGDVVPTVPLTQQEGWNYWKYGLTYITDLDYSCLWDSLGMGYENRLTIYAVHAILENWKSVSDYYSKEISDGENSTTLYDFFHDTADDWESKNKIQLRLRIQKLYNNYKNYNEIKQLLGTILKNLNVIFSHSAKTYQPLIEHYNSVDKNGINLFRRYTYQNCVYDFNNKMQFANSATISLNSLEDIQYDSLSVIQLTNFANINDNNLILDWDLDDPSTWDGVTWNSDGNVESIDLPYLNLTGTLNLTDFSSLTSVDISGNNISSLILDGCTSLEELDCSFNQLTTLDIDDCTNLTSLTCCYNYLDTHEGGTLYNTLDDLMFDDCYVNYYPQAVPENATFNATELNALKTFANTNDNNSVLDWLDENGNIDTDKLQNNVLFEYDGSNYRVVAIDISELDVSGTLNLTSLSSLEEIYCENTKITSLNVKGCTKLETLQCDGCEISSLTLPSNASSKNTTLYDVSCEYNYIDTSIFTDNIVEYINFKAGANLEYKNQKGDSSALQAVLKFANTINEKDYSANSFETLNDLIEDCNDFNFDNLYLTQDDIDDLTSEILTAIYNLKAYFNVNVSAPNGALSIAYDDETSSDTSTYSVLYGTNVTLSATPNEDYCFIGWYDTVNNRYLSNETQYTFKVDSNINLKAVFIQNGSATLTFANYSNWIAGTETKTTEEWAELTTISDLLPNVPYRFGYSNGRWVYTDSTVLAQLQAGQDVVINAEYDSDSTSLPTPRTATDEPLLDLYYNYDSANAVGSFVMAAGFPEDIQVESVGVAFYYKNASEFDPTNNFTLLLNNKMLASRFNTDTLEDIYIVNMNKMTSKYNWAARGYVTYYDENNNLVTAYSNQINIIDTQNADEITVSATNFDNISSSLNNTSSLQDFNKFNDCDSLNNAGALLGNSNSSDTDNNAIDFDGIDVFSGEND